MTPLVLQLQAEALEPNARIADLLRKCRVVAAKLDLKELAGWVESEITGYPNIDNLPNYRKLVGRLKALNPFHGWMPAHIQNRELELLVSTCHVPDAIGSLEETIRRSLEGAGHVVHPFSGEQQGVLANLFGFEGEYQIHIPAAAANGILDAVRNRVLEWSLSLERAGVLGEGMTFTIREREVAQSMTTGNTYNIHGNVGVLGEVAHSTVNSTQSVNYTQADLTELRGIIDQICNAVGQLPSKAQKSVMAALGDARTELDAAQPDHGRLKKALTSIRAACEGATGNLIAIGIVGLIAKFLS